MSKLIFNAARTGFALGRVTTVPQTVHGLVAALIGATQNWVTLSTATRDDGGEIATVSRNINRYASDLVTLHGADETAVENALVTRSVLTATPNALIAAFYPTRYRLDADGELVSIDDDANAAANAAADDADNGDAGNGDDGDDADADTDAS